MVSHVTTKEMRYHVFRQRKIQDGKAELPVVAVPKEALSVLVILARSQNDAYALSVCILIMRCCVSGSQTKALLMSQFVSNEGRK